MFWDSSPVPDSILMAPPLDFITVSITGLHIHFTASYMTYVPI